MPDFLYKPALEAISRRAGVMDVHLVDKDSRTEVAAKRCRQSWQYEKVNASHQ